MFHFESISTHHILLSTGHKLYFLAQESINVVLSVLVREIRALEKNIKELDKAIEQVIVVIPEYQCLTSIPGVGKVYDVQIGTAYIYKQQFF
ncbi:hypothetical protein EfmAA610_25070 [Enterococcus faecium]|nr:hypothetical protein EfmAA610_25070 [Enterococcus faecium]